MYAQAAIKPNTLLRNGAYVIVMKGVQKCTCAGASLRGRNSAPLCCIKLDTATDIAQSILIQLSIVQTMSNLFVNWTKNVSKQFSEDIAQSILIQSHSLNLLPLAV